jgi:hypothetical protein
MVFKVNIGDSEIPMTIETMPTTEPISIPNLLLRSIVDRWNRLDSSRILGTTKEGKTL